MSMKKKYPLGMTRKDFANFKICISIFLLLVCDVIFSITCYPYFLSLLQYVVDNMTTKNMNQNSHHDSMLKYYGPKSPFQVGLRYFVQLTSEYFTGNSYFIGNGGVGGGLTSATNTTTMMTGVGGGGNTVLPSHP